MSSLIIYVRKNLPQIYQSTSIFLEVTELEDIKANLFHVLTSQLEKFGFDSNFLGKLPISSA